MDNTSPQYRNSQYATSAEAEGISPYMLGKEKEVDEFDLDREPKHRHQQIRKRLSSKFSSNTHHTSTRLGMDGSGTLPLRNAEHEPTPNTSDNSHHHIGTILDEVTAWLKEEKKKKKARKAKKKAKKGLHKNFHLHRHDDEADGELTDRSIRSSASSDSSLDLGRLESILQKGMRSGVDLGSGGILPASPSSTNLRRIGSRSQRINRRASTLKPSDTEIRDDEIHVPGCDAILDNSKTFSKSAAAVSQVDTNKSETDGAREPWPQFKHELLRITHTLKLSRWRHLPMSMSTNIHVERLSGALTNAVYVVSPPDGYDPNNIGDGKRHTERKYPLKLLLRIYGAQTEHLIDREAELSILRRLCKKNIGPRMLGTFKNGRFEEFLHARALKPQDLRHADTSRQISKRMRELHDGIELLEPEREAGPFVWQNWDKRVERAEHVMKFVDQQTCTGRRASKIGLGKTSKPSGYVCGTSWGVFRKTVERYRKHLEKEYGGREKLNAQMVFAHNDTQYGNILRLEPPGESPLLLPANQHKQLVVIDFEYANANVPGLEFSNHFTEWCYNYHDPSESYACNTSRYPTLEEQIRFLRSYVEHQPQHNPAAPTTPRFTPLHRTGSFSSLDLDHMASKTERASTQFNEQLLRRQADKERAEADAAAHDEVRRLLRETQLWRMANSAQWVVWGILQAVIPGMPQEIKDQVADGIKEGEPASDPLDAENEAANEDFEDKRPEPEEGEGDDEFDCLAYSRDRAMFFWGDCLQMGLVTEEELGKELVSQVKIVSC